MCVLVPRGQTCWRLGLVYVGARRPDYRWRLGSRTYVGASKPPRHAARLVSFAKFPHGPDPLRKDQVGPGGLFEPNGYRN